MSSMNQNLVQWFMADICCIWSPSLIQKKKSEQGAAGVSYVKGSKQLKITLQRIQIFYRSLKNPVLKAMTASIIWKKNAKPPVWRQNSLGHLSDNSYSLFRGWSRPFFGCFRDLNPKFCYIINMNENKF